MQLNSVKRVLLTEPQIKLLKYQNKYLNLKNPNDSMKFLQSLEITNKVNENLFEGENDNEDIDTKMCDGFINYYNF